MGQAKHGVSRQVAWPQCDNHMCMWVLRRWYRPETHKSLTKMWELSWICQRPRKPLRISESRLMVTQPFEQESSWPLRTAPGQAAHRTQQPVFSWKDQVAENMSLCRATVVHSLDLGPQLGDILNHACLCLSPIPGKYSQSNVFSALQPSPR